MRKYRIQTGCTLLILLSLSIRTLAISFPVPRGTFPAAINKRGDVVGYCIDSIAVAHGFIRNVRGRITAFDAPGAGAGQRQGTFATDINNAGTIVGYYIDSKLLHHGFVRDPNGALTRLDAPGAGAGLGPPIPGHPELLSGQGTLAFSINDGGTITGDFIDAKDVRHGFLRNQLGTFLTFDVPGSGGTIPASINDSGEITGTYDDPPEVSDNARMHSYRSGAVHGFLRDTNGTITRLDVPGVVHGPGQDTYPQTVNDSGTIVGWDDRSDGGFIRDAHGAYATFSVPEPSIHPIGSNGGEEITACYLGAKGATQGPTRNENSATAVSSPAGLGPGRYQGCICASLIGGGALVGYFEDEHRTNHGFIRNEHGALTIFDAPCDGNSIVITSVSPIIAGAIEAIIIKGRRFGGYRSSTGPHEGRILFQDEAVGRACGEDVTPDNGEGSALRVARWTDAEIKVSGFSWPPKGICPFHAGDHVTIGVWNTRTGAGPARFELTVGSTSKDLTPPRIVSVTPMYAGADQNFIIKGHGFGTHPTDQDSDYLEIENETVSWISRREVPRPTPDRGGFEPITVRVGRWTPNEIEVTGFSGAYGRDHWTLNAGDQIKVKVWNPQTGSGPATYELTVVGTGQNLLAPRITSLTPLTTQANQTIIIKGQGFGNRPPYMNQTTPYLLISDETANWVAGRGGANNVYSVMLSVSRWTDTEIEVNGFGGGNGTHNRKLNAGDQIKVKVWNAQTGAGPAVMSEEVSQSSNGKQAGPSLAVLGLTNDDVIKLVQVKLPDSLIIAKIKSSACAFDMSPDGVDRLKQAGVSDAVLLAMLKGGVKPLTAPRTSPTINLLQPRVSGLTVFVNGVTLPTTPGATVSSVTWSFGTGRLLSIPGFPPSTRSRAPGRFW